MENLLQLIQNNDGQNAVSARNLYTFLGYDLKNWKRWYTKNIVNNDFAIESIDFQTLVIERSEYLKGNFSNDFALSIEFAKKISMMARTEKGEEARKYFIECEKIAKQSIQIQPQIQIPQTFAEALKLAYEQQLTIERLETRTKFVDVVFNSDDLLTGAQVCKLLNLSYGNKTLYKTLREKGLFFKNRNEPKQLFVDKGYFRMKEVLIKDKVKIQTYFTQKGLGYIAKYLGVIIQPITTVKMIN